jgi:hypothetical protein
MNKKNIMLGLGVMALLFSISGISATTADAYRGDMTVKGPNYTAERHILMEKAFETNDYTAWKNLMTNNGKVTKVINKDNFAKFSEARELAKNGDISGAKKLRQELGLGLKDGSGLRQGNMAGKGVCPNK